jgi:hypothetical protein
VATEEVAVTPGPFIGAGFGPYAAMIRRQFWQNRSTSSSKACCSTFRRASSITVRLR